MIDIAQGPAHASRMNNQSLGDRVRYFGQTYHTRSMVSMPTVTASTAVQPAGFRRDTISSKNAPARPPMLKTFLLY